MNTTSCKLHFYAALLLSAALLLVISSCSSRNMNLNNPDQMRQQISLLETQNALLVAKNQSQGDQPQTELTVPQNTPTNETLPTEPVPAGQPIVYDEWSMMVSRELNNNEIEDIWGIDIYVENLRESDRIFRFTNAAVTIRDNTGYDFPPSTLCPYMGCSSCEEYYHTVKNLSVSGKDSIVISSGTSGNGCMDDDGIGMFIGPIPLNSEQLIIQFDGFGPFTGIEVVIDL